jgi:hypothetical protein
MIFAKKKKILVWCDDPQEDPVISVFAGCLANHDRAHSQGYLSQCGEVSERMTPRRTVQSSITSMTQASPSYMQDIHP